MPVRGVCGAAGHLIGQNRPGRKLVFDSVEHVVVVGGGGRMVDGVGHAVRKLNSPLNALLREDLRLYSLD